MKPELQQKILGCTRGSKLGAILRCALNVDRTDIPRFTSKAIVTSDGYLMANFVDSDGHAHLGAFVGSKSDLLLNVDGLAKHLSLSPEERSELVTLIDGWMCVEIIRVGGPAKKARAG